MLRFLLVLSLLVVMGATPLAAQGADRRHTLLVGFEPGVSAAQRADAHADARAAVVDRVAAIAVDVVTVPAAARERARARYGAAAGVRFVEDDVVVRPLGDVCDETTCLAPDDPALPRQWHLQNDERTIQPDATWVHDADIDAPFAWKLTEGNPATRIAILDSGIDRDHEDLAAKVVSSRNFTTSRTTDDKYGHGTAVAGAAAAITNNGIGVAGTGFDSSLMNVKVLTDRGISSCSAVANGITWAADNGAHVINLSLSNPDCSAMATAAAYAWEKGALLTAAAGNRGDSSVTYPAVYPSVIAVAATDNSDLKASFSNYGSWVDMAAPGVSVYTTFPNHRNQLGKRHYDYGNGTSMSAPLVAGAAALVWSRVADENGNGRVNDEVRARLETYADAIAGTGTDWSAGRLNLCRVVDPANPGC